MEEKCFCESDKVGYPSLYERLCCCICDGKTEKLIKLNCCGKYVHKSCFINSSIIYSNNIINSNDTLDTYNINELKICHYCRKPYDMCQFPDIPHTNEEVKLINKNRKLKNISIMFWIIIIILSLGNGLADNILLGTYKNKGMDLYKTKFIDNCELNYMDNCNQTENINKCCQTLFSKKNSWSLILVVLTSILSFIPVSIICSEHAEEFREKYLKLLEIIDPSTTYYISTYKYEYKEHINKLKNIYKSNLMKFIIPICMLVWQLGYLAIINSYNKWYIPSHTSSNTTLEEAHQLVLNYIPVLCLFNILWILLICLGLIIIGVLFCCCLDCYVEERNKIKNNILDGDNNIKIYNEDNNQSFKKSNVDYV
jgi:hypothetical protein